MASEIKSCYIYSEKKLLPSIFLPDKQEVFVGRSVDTKITDTQCSRKQVRLYASYSDQKVYIQQVGRRACGLNGFKTEQGEKFIARHGDCLEVLYGKHIYKIEFNPSNKVKVQIATSSKRLLSDDSEEEAEDNLRNHKKSKFGTYFGDEVVMEEVADEKESKKNIEENLNLPSTSFSNISSTSVNDNIHKSTQNGTWEVYSDKTLYVYTSNDCKGRSKIAAYDMDKTLIKTISGLAFPKDCNDWQLLYPDVPGKIKKFYEDDYKIVIFSNQASLGTGKISVKDFKLKIERLVKKIGVPMQVYLAAGQSIYRKPCTGMWDFLVSENNDGVPVDKENSFYVGDAAGRPADLTRKKKDHSLADRLLALNVGLTFQTPEEHFLGHKKASYNAPVFNPKEASKNTVLYEPSQAALNSDTQELIIMVGCPGSGKSHFAKTYLPSYHYINRDSLGSWQKCVTGTEEALIERKSVVVDNTNPDKVSRQRYIDLAKKHNIPVRCFVMTLDKEHIKHNNMFRILTDPTHQVISDMVINSYLKSCKVEDKTNLLDSEDNYINKRKASKNLSDQNIEKNTNEYSESIVNATFKEVIELQPLEEKNNNQTQKFKCKNNSRNEERKVMENFFDKLTAQEMDRINEHLLKFLVLNNLNFDIVLSPSFKQFIEKLRPAFLLPSVYDLNNTILDNVYNSCTKNMLISSTCILFIYAKKNNFVSMVCNVDKHFFCVKVSFNYQNLNKFILDSISIVKCEYKQMVYAVISNFFERLSWKMEFEGQQIWHFSCTSVHLKKLAQSIIDLDLSAKLLEVYKSIETNLFKNDFCSSIDLKSDGFVNILNIVSHCKNNLKKLCQFAVDERSKVGTETLSLLFNDTFEIDLNDVHTIFNFLCETNDKSDYLLAEFVKDFYILREKLATNFYKTIFDSLRELLTPIALVSNFLHPSYKGRNFMSDPDISKIVYKFLIDELNEVQMAQLQDYNSNEGIFLRMREKNYKNPKLYWSVIQTYKFDLAEFSLKLLSIPAFTKSNNFDYVPNESLSIIQKIKMEKLFFALKINE